MGTQELIKAVQTNVVANYIITHPVNLQARQKHEVANVKLRSVVACVLILLVLCLSFILMFFALCIVLFLYYYYLLLLTGKAESESAGIRLAEGLMTNES